MDGMGGLGVIALVSVIGIFSCVGVIYKNSKKNVKQLDRVIELLEDIRASSRPEEK